MFVGLDRKSPNSTALGTHVPGGWRGEPLSVLSTADMCEGTRAWGRAWHWDFWNSAQS